MSLDCTSVTGLVLHFRTPEKTLVCLKAMQQEGITQVVLVDNSEDNGESVASMQIALIQLREDGFFTDILSQNKNLGFATGVSYGLKYIGSHYPSHVLLINSDARLEQGALNKLQQALDNSDLVAPHIAQQEEKVSSPFYYYDRLFALITTQPKFFPVKYPSGCCLLIHKNLIKSSIFEELFFFYGEDIMLGYSALKKDLHISECPNAHIIHATSSSAKNGSLFYEYHINRAHWLLANTLADTPLQRFIFTLARCFILPIRATLRSIRFRSLNAWHGLLLATYDILTGKFRSLTPKSD